MIENYNWLAYHFGLVPANNCPNGTRGFTFKNKRFGHSNFISTEDFCAVLRVARHCFRRGKEISVYDHDRGMFGIFTGADELYIRCAEQNKIKCSFHLSKSATHQVLNRVINTDFRWIQRTKRGPKWIAK